MLVRTEQFVIARDAGHMRVFIAKPAGDGRRPALAFYSDIFCLTESTQRMAIRFAGYGFVVAAPELYRRFEPPGTSFPFDDVGKARGLEISRMRFVPEVRATVCFYPTGLHDGALGADDARSLERVSEVGGSLDLVFGTRNAHTTATQRERIVETIERSGSDARITYVDADHAFMRDVGFRYDPQASDEAVTSSVARFRSRLAAMVGGAR